MWIGKRQRDVHGDLPGWQAGLVAAAAYAAVQEVDLRLLRYNADDLFLTGGLVTTTRAQARALGLAQHLLTGALVGEVFTRIGQRVLPGTPIQQGVTFIMLENVSGFALTPFFQYKHPRIQDGSLAPYWHWRAFLQATLRHLVFGWVLGRLAGPRRG